MIELQSVSRSKHPVSRSTQVITIDSVSYHSVVVEEEEEAEAVEEAVVVEEVVSVNVHRDPQEALVVTTKVEKKSKKLNLNLMSIIKALLNRKSSGFNLNRRWRKLQGYKIKKEGNKRCKQKPK